MPNTFENFVYLRTYYTYTSLELQFMLKKQILAQILKCTHYSSSHFGMMMFTGGGPMEAPIVELSAVPALKQHIQFPTTFSFEDIHKNIKNLKLIYSLCCTVFFQSATLPFISNFGGSHLPYTITTLGEYVCYNYHALKASNHWEH